MRRLGLIIAPFWCLSGCFDFSLSVRSDTETFSNPNGTDSTTMDTATEDTATDTPSDDTAAADTATTDTEDADTATAVADTTFDSGHLDTATIDTEMPDTAIVDTTSDTTRIDTTPVDTDTADSTTADTEATDTATEDTETDSSMTDPCSNFFCPPAPQPRCSAASGRLLYNTTDAYCDASGDGPRCVFPEIEIKCPVPGGCVQDRCEAEPCLGIVCDSPPLPQCIENDTALLVYLPHGTCGGLGECHYQTERVECIDGCQNGTCKNAPCAGIHCSTPPARFCDGNTQVVWRPAGRCTADGTCVYDFDETSCAAGCTAGRCNEVSICSLLTCTNPPPNHCLSDTQLLVYDLPGACDGEACVYQSNEISCTGNCVDGRCVDDPCAGIQCIFPPASYCTNAEGLVVFDDTAGPTGSCEDGVCFYDLKTVSCPSGTCIHGRCEAEPCLGTDGYCGPMSRPTAYCEGKNALSVSETGTCDTEAGCVYTITERTCPNKCELGACN